MGKSRKRRKRTDSSSEEEDSSDVSETETESSSEDDSEYEDSYDSSGSSESESEDSESDSDESDEDYEQLLEVLTRNNMKTAAKKLVAKKVYTVNKARSIPVPKLVKKYGLKESEAKQLKKLLNNPTALLPAESSDSETDSSGSEDEDEKVFRILRSIDQQQMIRLFKRNQINTLKKAYKLTEKKLKKYGIVSKQVREKIVKEFQKKKDNLTSSEEDDEIKVAKLMKGINMKPYIKNLQKGKVTDLESAYNLTSSSLKQLGVTAKRDRKKILKAFKEYKKTHAEEDPSLTILKRALTKVGLKKYYTKLKNKDIDSIRKLKKIDHKELREIGVQMYRERRDILEKIEKIHDNGTVELEDNSEDGEELSDDNVVKNILQSLYMSRHIGDFKRANIKTLKEARKLTQTQLRAMGVGLYLDREKLINAFKDYRPKNKKIMQILIDQNLARHTSEFEKLVDIDEARALTHADLRAMGVSLYGQRDRLIKAFANYTASASESSSESDYQSNRSKSSKSRRRKKKR